MLIPEGDDAAVLTDSAMPVDGAQLIIDQVAAANAPEEPPAPPADTITDEPGDLIAGKFKNTDDLINAYQELERGFTGKAQTASELERQVAEMQAQLEQMQQPPEHLTPLLPFGVSEPTSLEELEQLAEADPAKAAIWAMDNAQRLDPEIVRNTMNYWYQRDPVQANAYQINQMMQQFIPQVQSQVTPLVEQRQEQMINNAVDMAEQQIGPNYTAYSDRITQFIQTNPQFVPDNAYSDPQVMASTIVNVYAMLLGHDQLSQGQAISQAPPVTAQAQTITSTAGTTSTTNAAITDEDAINALIQAQVLSGGRGQ